MANVLAIESLIAAVNTRFANDGTQAVNVFGWRMPAQHAEGNRIVWEPGDHTGKLGDSAAPRQPGRNPRPIATLHELFTITINAVDTSDVENEALQYRAARLLHDAWFRAVYLAAHGTFAVLASEWLIDRVERRYGAALRVVLALEAMIPDAPAQLAPVDTSALIDLSLGDNTETDTITAT